ncbi:MAG TPA: oxidoreductase [Anaerolineaceae bacterium]|nr:oxidoreductase [Anaerolineaceae bacterium]
MIRLFQVDAFTDMLFHGNPAAVYIHSESRSDEWMKNLAAEMNLSETAFLQPASDGYHLRWFTPVTEVELCGHATLASAWILFTEGFEPYEKEIHFHTLSGLLTARWHEGAVVLNFPAFTHIREEQNSILLDALGLREGRVWQVDDQHWVIEVANAHILRELRPDFSKMIACGCGEAAVTSLSDDSAYDFMSRFFAPTCGIDEDPVTGSSHCSLAPFWMRRLNKNPLRAYQASARGGSLLIEVLGNRVDLHGKAITVFRADLA